MKIGFFGAGKMAEGILSAIPAKKDVIMAEKVGHTFDSYVNNLMEMGDGRLLVYENFYEQWSDAPEGTELYSDEWYSSSQYKDGAALRILDSTGAELSRVELDPDLGPDQYFYPYNMLLSPDGML